MRTTRWIGAAVAVLAIAAGAVNVRNAGVAEAATFGPAMVVGGTSEQVEMARWAVGRFESAGLTLPPIQIRFHADLEGCGGHLGYYRRGAVDVCGVSANLMARRNLLHEMSHAWAETNVTGDRRVRFLELRGLETWNGYYVPWRERGFEHAAEILAWHLGDRILTPTVPDNEREQLEAAVEALLEGQL